MASAGFAACMGGMVLKYISSILIGDIVFHVVISVARDSFTGKFYLFAFVMHPMCFLTGI